MRATRTAAWLVLAFFAAGPVLLPTAEAQSTNFVDANTLDLTTLLPPPPSADSAETKVELAEIHGFEKARTPERERIAQEDASASVFAVIRGDLGPNFTAEKLPATANFFDKLFSDAGVVIDPAKDVWARKRPAMVDPSVKLCVQPSTSGSYPSGHATLAYLSAIVLGDMVPEKRPVLFADAARFAESRVVCGVHYRSDIMASRTAAALIVQQMRANPAFQKDFAAARAELRAALNK